MHTVKFVVGRSDYTVRTLRNVTEYLSLAKNISVAQVFLPSDVMSDIDKLDMELTASADTIEEKTTENSKKIQRVFNIMYGIFTSPISSLLSHIFWYALLTCNSLMQKVGANLHRSNYAYPISARPE